jgi:ketosteroid isomerase-like protein
MNKIVASCFLGLALLAGSAWSQGQMSGTEQAVAALEQQWLKSQQTNNVDLLVPLLADKFFDTTSEGKVTGKKETVALAKSVKWSSAEYMDVKVSVYGDAAVATGAFKGKGTDGAGKPLAIYERWTDTWVKMSDGKWQCVASQGTPVKM